MIIAIRDDAMIYLVQEIWANSFPSVVHTAGAVLICQEIRGSNKPFGVLYPLQSLRKEIETIPPLSMLVDGNHAEY